MTVNCTTAITGEGPRHFNSGKRRYDFVYYRDGERAEWSGTSVLMTQNDPEDRSHSEEYTWVANAKYVVNAMRPAGDTQYVAFFGNSLRKDLNGRWMSPETGAFLDGRLWLDKGAVHIADLLAEGSRVIRNETIDGRDCVVMESSTQYGKLTAWLARDLGYNAIQYSLLRTPDDLTNGKTLREQGLTEMATRISGIQFKEIGGSFVPVKGTFTHKAIFADGSVRTSEVVATRTNVSVNPDFAALNAFVPKLPDGAILQSVDAPGILFEYVQGDIRPAMDAGAISRIDATMDTWFQTSQSRAKETSVLPSPHAQSQPASAAANDGNVSHFAGLRGSHLSILISGVLVGILAGIVVMATRRNRRRTA